MRPPGTCTLWHTDRPKASSCRVQGEAALAHARAGWRGSARACRLQPGARVCIPAGTCVGGKRLAYALLAAIHGGRVAARGSSRTLARSWSVSAAQSSVSLSLSPPCLSVALFFRLWQPRHSSTIMRVVPTATHTRTCTHMHAHTHARTHIHTHTK